MLIKKEYYEGPFANEFNNLYEMEKLISKDIKYQNLLKKIDNPNNPISIKRH